MDFASGGGGAPRVTRGGFPWLGSPLGLCVLEDCHSGFVVSNPTLSSGLTVLGASLMLDGGLIWGRQRDNVPAVVSIKDGTLKEEDSFICT